jgi:predicted ArsR family transcriptional regulator
MTSSDLARTDPAGEPALGASRGRVLAVLQESARAVTVDEVAERVQLHVNTVRFHLDGLVEAGLAERESERRVQPGRPRTLYRAGANAPRAGDRSYRLLSQILASYVATHTPQPGKAALKAGEVWGRYLTKRPAPFQRVDAATATDQLVETLEDIGFAPEAVTTGRSRRVLLHHCPFREAAEEHREVVCSIHLGLMRGLLDELGAPLEARRLDPFVEPSLCVTHLATPGTPDPPARKRAG